MWRPKDVLLHVSSKTTQWLWLRGNAVGAPPPPRRGCSATAISNGRQIVFIGGSVTSPCQNFDDVHVLDTRGNGIEMELDVRFPKRFSNTCLASFHA